MTDVYKTPASKVRTGHVITTEESGYRLTLEVDYVHHGTKLVDGVKVPVVWFTGWASTGTQVERGWGHSPDTEVLVVEDRRGNSFRTVDIADPSDLDYLLTQIGDHTMQQLPDTIYTTINGQSWRYNPDMVNPALTNAAMPLTCGHKFVTGDIIWMGRPVDEQAPGDTQAVCSRCVEKVAA